MASQSTATTSDKQAEASVKPKHRVCLATRAQVVALKQHGVTNARVSAITGVEIRHVQRLWAKAISRGYDPKKSTVILDKYLVDGSKSGRPRKADKKGASDQNAGNDTLKNGHDDKQLSDDEELDGE